MAYILYYLVLIPLSLLPWPAIYGISTFLSFLLQKVIGYRAKTIDRNLKRSFPDKSEKELLQIKTEFYTHFTDQWMETLKLFTISKKEVIKRCKLINPGFLDQFQGQHVMVTMGHYNNWEMVAVAIAPQIKHTPVAIYNEVKNPFFDKKMLESRSKFGLRMISKKKAKRSIVDKDDDESIVFFVADQSGLTSKKVYWLPFLNQDTAVVTGPERYAHMLDAPVVFLEVQKVKRGHYELEFHKVADDPKSMDNGEITVRHAKILENVIKKRPQYWLWTHNRWKKGRKPDNQIEFDLEGILEKMDKESIIH